MPMDRLQRPFLQGRKRVSFAAFIEFLSPDRTKSFNLCAVVQTEVFRNGVRGGSAARTAVLAPHFLEADFWPVWSCRVQLPELPVIRRVSRKILEIAPRSVCQNQSTTIASSPSLAKGHGSCLPRHRYQAGARRRHQGPHRVPSRMIPTAWRVSSARRTRWRSATRSEQESHSRIVLMT